MERRRPDREQCGQAVLNNAYIEGVKDKVDVLNENAMNMSFADDYFDVILTNMCLHNIYNAPGRKKACQEISRVLKPEVRLLSPISGI